MFFETMRLMSSRTTKRIVKPQSGWGIETENLEDRALLSATGRCAAMAHGDGVAAEVATSDQKAVTVANVSGDWHVHLSYGPYGATADVGVFQNGKTFRGASDADLGDLFVLKGKLKGTQAKLTGDVIASGQLFKLKGFVLTFSNNFTAFDGSKTVAGLGTVTIHGTKTGS